MNVTLATLPQATPQQVFDHVVRRMRSQGFRQSLRYGSDMGPRNVYRDGHGCSCPAGHCMTDDEYASVKQAVGGEVEGKGWHELAADGVVPAAHVNLIKDLQLAHDKSDKPRVLRQRMREVAARHDLEARF